jgi:hypothetical protein
MQHLFTSRKKLPSLERSASSDGRAAVKSGTIDEGDSTFITQGAVLSTVTTSIVNPSLPSLPAPKPTPGATA